LDNGHVHQIRQTRWFACIAVLPFGFEEKGDQGLAKAGATRVSATTSL